MSTTYAQLGKSAKISYERILDDVCALYQTENKLLRDLAIDIMRVLDYGKEFKVVLERHVEENPFQQEETINVYAKVSQVRHGRWIGTEFDGYADGVPVYDVYECSECGMEYDATDDGEITHNYCPNCGAKMDGGDGDDKID